MCWWDKQFIQKLLENNIILLLYKRYVDDIKMLIDKLKKATQNRDETEDKAIMDKIREIGNSIHKSIEITTDTPSEHSDKKMPVLDLKVWSETREGQDGIMRNKIIHEFYQKEISSKTVALSQSS